jgi:hypothetical protein
VNAPDNISSNEKQERAVRLLVLSFKQNHNNGNKKIKAAEIIEKLKTRNYNISDAELRQLFAFIRRHDLAAPGFILSDNEGYWYSEDEAEMQRVWKSQYNRAIEIMTNFAPLHKRFKHLLTDKDSLFT